MTPAPSPTPDEQAAEEHEHAWSDWIPRWARTPWRQCGCGAWEVFTYPVAPAVHVPHATHAGSQCGSPGPEAARDQDVTCVACLHYLLTYVKAYGEPASLTDPLVVAREQLALAREQNARQARTIARFQEVYDVARERLTRVEALADRLRDQHAHGVTNGFKVTCDLCFHDTCIEEGLRQILAVHARSETPGSET